MISILCPTRGRPKEFLRMIESVYVTAINKDNIEVVAYIDSDDTSFVDYPHPSTSEKLIYVHGDRIILTDCWNKCFSAARGDIHLQGNDDVLFRTPGWDVAVEQEFANCFDKILLVHGSDEGQHFDRFGAHSFVHRRWIEAIGYFIPPWFVSDFGDSVTGDSILLIRQAGRIRLDTIAALYQSAIGKPTVTEVKSEKQFKKLEDIEILIPVNGKAEWHKVDSVMRHFVKRKRIVELSTRRGKKLKLTKDHGIFEFNNPLELNGTLCSPEQLTPKKSKVIGFLPNLSSIQNGVEKLESLTISLRTPLFIGKVSKNEKDDDKKRKWRMLPYKVRFDKEFSEFLGLWLADGSVNSKGDDSPAGIYISAAQDAECRNLLESIAKQFNGRFDVADNGVDSGITSARLESIIKVLFEATSFSSHTKEVPWWVFQLSEENIAAFLRGYFSGDGSATGGGVSCSSSSIKLAYAIYYLLSSIGIRAYFSTDIPKIDPNAGDFQQKRVMYNLSIIDYVNLEIFMRKVRFLQERKNTKIIFTRKSVTGLQGVQDPQIDEIETLLVKSINEIKHHVNYVYDEIVYDLCVPGVEKFVANGILVHNTHLNEVAGKLQRRKYIPIIIEHLHFLFNKAPMDKTYEERLQRHREQNPDALYCSKEMTERRIKDAEKLRRLLNTPWERDKNDK